MYKEGQEIRPPPWTPLAGKGSEPPKNPSVGSCFFNFPLHLIQKMVPNPTQRFFIALRARCFPKPNPRVFHRASREVFWWEKARATVRFTVIALFRATCFLTFPPFGFFNLSYTLPSVPGNRGGLFF